MGQISMDANESKKYRLACKVLAGKITIKEFALLIGKSYRQSQRLVKQVQIEDLTGVIHKNKGRNPVNKTPPELEATIIDLLTYKYSGFNLTHFLEFAKRNDNISISKSALHRIAKKHGLIKNPRRAKRRSFKPRPRLPQEGMLVQFDGSNHVWFGDVRTDLIVGIDDATGKILAAEIFFGEKSLHCLKVIKKIVDDNGLPEAFYMDQAGIFGKQDRDWESQISRAFEQTNIRLILASTPQAKGRVERLNRTLQDRLVAEFKFYNVTTIEEANKYLQKYIKEFNKMFGVEPEEQELAYRRNIFGDTNLIFCKKETRRIGVGNTFSWKAVQWVLNEKRCFRGRVININTHVDESQSFDIMGRKIEAKVFKVSSSFAQKKRAM
jgi:hypothetical protein